MKIDSGENIANSIKVIHLIQILNNYDQDADVKLIIYGSSDYPDAALTINGNIIMASDW
jgi:hypothetical protein